MLPLAKEDGMVTIEEVAETLSVSVMTVRRLVKSGDIPAYAIGGQLRFKEDELAAYVDSRRVQGVPNKSLRPANPSDAQLRKVGVEWRDSSHGILGCLNCGAGWATMLQPGGKLPRGYWRCPNGCNSDEALAQREQMAHSAINAGEPEVEEDEA